MHITGCVFGVTSVLFRHLSCWCDSLNPSALYQPVSVLSTSGFHLLPLLLGPGLSCAPMEGQRSNYSEVDTTGKIRTRNITTKKAYFSSIVPENYHQTTACLPWRSTITFLCYSRIHLQCIMCLSLISQCKTEMIISYEWSWSVIWAKKMMGIKCCKNVHF